MAKNIIQVYEHQTVNSIVLGNSAYEVLKKFRSDKDNFNFFELTNNGIKFKQYVGVLQVGNVTIEVLPKIDKGNDTVEDTEKSKWQKILIDMLRFTGTVNVKHTENANLSIKHNSILELYFEIFIIEVERLLHLGLIKKYRKTEGNLGALKGKLKFNKHVTKNIVHKEKFYVEYTTYDTDHILHRILYKTIKLIKNISNSSKLSSKIGNLLLNFPELKNIKVDENTFDKLNLNRKTESYRNAINISKMLLLNYHPDISNGRRDVLALMFDMNVLWEKFVLKTLNRSENFIKSENIIKDYDINGQKEKPFWQGSRNTKLKPDILFKKEEGSNKIRVIIDTKWKQAKNEKDLPSNGDLQQLFAYSMYWDCKKVALLYPGETSRNIDYSSLNDDDYRFAYKKEPKIQCNLLFAGGGKIEMKTIQEDICETVNYFLK